MREVLISIKPKWCELIANGKKTVEVRKTKPKLETPFKAYIYCTKSKKHFLQSRSNMFFYCEDKDFIGGHGAGAYQRLNGKVIGEFVCDELTGGFWISPFSDYLQRQSCLSYDEVCDYANGKPIFAWHISNLVIYDKPRELNEFLIDCKSCSKKFVGDIDCWHGCINGYRKITRPPQSWCYVESGDTE